MSWHVMSCCVASDQSCGRKVASLLCSGGAPFKHGGGRCAHSARLHESAPKQSDRHDSSHLYKVDLAFQHLPTYPTICVVRSVFKLSGHPSSSLSLDFLFWHAALRLISGIFNYLNRSESMDSMDSGLVWQALQWIRP